MSHTFSGLSAKAPRVDATEFMHGSDYPQSSVVIAMQPPMLKPIVINDTPDEQRVKGGEFNDVHRMTLVEAGFATAMCA